MSLAKQREMLFEQWYSRYGTRAKMNLYFQALKDPYYVLDKRATNPGRPGFVQTVDRTLFPPRGSSLYELVECKKLKALFVGTAQDVVADDGSMRAGIGCYALWLRLADPEEWEKEPFWDGDCASDGSPTGRTRMATLLTNGFDYLKALENRKRTYKMDKYLAAIRTKPFILLAGISGTGKSRLVRQLARGCCPSGHELGKNKAGDADKAKRPGNFEMIPVRPNWHDSTELMGYVTRLTDGNKPKYVIKPFVKFLVKAAIYKDVPFFLCLDEMNLAPVEQYFAEYLSIVETRKKENGAIISDVLVNFDLPEIDVVETVKELMKDWWSLDADNNLQWATADAKAVYDKIVADKGIRIPENFIVMGTVNMDETTCSFSRKVLDRAMTFELNEVDMDEGLAEDNSIRYGSIPASSAFATDVEGCDFYAANKDTCEKIKTYLIAVNKVLDGTPFKFAYRSRNEIMLYCIERTKGGIVELPQALDEATSMKILSRIEGDEQKLQVPKRDNNGNVVKSTDGRAEMVCLLDKDVLPKVIADALKKANGDKDPNPPCTVCSEKLAFMAGRLESGFTNFFV